MGYLSSTKRSPALTKVCLRASIALMLLFAPLASIARDIIVIYDNKSNYQTPFVNALSDNLAADSNVSITPLTTSDFSIEVLINNLPDTVISLNDQVSEQLVNANIQTSVYHALTTLSSARKYAPCLPQCASTLPRHHFFVLDALPSRQIQLINLILPTAKQVALILTPQSKPHLSKISSSAKSNGITIKEYLTDASNVRYLIEDISRTSDIILAVADTDIYNATTLPQILLTSYRYRTPVIGFSKGFIKAGAIAGIVSNIKQLAHHLTEVISLDRDETFPLDHVTYPKYFDVLSNKNVARSLNLHIPSDVTLKAIIQKNEASK